MRTQQQEDRLAYWRDWENDAVLGVAGNPSPPTGSSEDESFLGGEFSLSELLNVLPSDRPERGMCDSRDLPPLAAVCATPDGGPGSSSAARARKICELLAEGADPRERDPVYGRSPLHWACLHADLEAVRLIVDALKSTTDLRPDLQQQAAISIARDINQTDVNGLTPIQAVLALRRSNAGQHADIVEYLIAQGADLGALPQRGAELLFADFLTIDIARTVLASGISADVRDAAEATPLLKAALVGNVPLMTYLLQQGADPRQRVFFGGGMLNHYGVNTDAAALLLAQGVDPNLRDELGMTPLMFACQDKNLLLIRLLLRHGASVRAKSADGMRVADYAPDEETLRFLETEAGLAPGIRLADD